MRKLTVNQAGPPSGASSAWRGLSRRRFFRTAAGTGAGVVLGSKLSTARADEDDDDDKDKHSACSAPPRPIPHINNPPGQHFFFPGPVDGSFSPFDPTSPPPATRDPSIITDFKGVIAAADLVFFGTGTDLNTGKSDTYKFHADMRLMKGVFVGLDNEQHHGEVGFI